jgi:MoaA/NifB/PqqE/SkfB family radical SAM enzyme
VDQLGLSLKYIHILLTLRCDRECDHCFVWGSPSNEGIFTLKDIMRILMDAKEIGTVEQISFEGGEPFLYYPILVKGVEEAVKLGFRVEIVTNVYWATSLEDAIEWLKPFKDYDSVFLSLSTDLFHDDKWINDETLYAIAAAKKLGIPVSLLITKHPTIPIEITCNIDKELIYVTELMYRGRAAEKLIKEIEGERWDQYRECPYEDLKNQSRVHIDPYGNVHVCQGITIGNVREERLLNIIAKYDPGTHPIVAPIIRGGPAELVKVHSIPHQNRYVDACHLCYQARKTLRAKYPDILLPKYFYGEI